MSSYSLPVGVSVADAQSAAATTLEQSGSQSAKLDAAVLLCHALDKPQSYLFTWPEKELDAQQRASFEALVTRRIAGEPVAYIVGTREFWSMELEVSPTTLIPRPDTERLVELALDKVTDGAKVLDLGTGTGAIALAIASEQPAADVTGVDFQSDAVALSKRNAAKFGINNAKFVQSDWFAAIGEDERFSLIVSNPPYIDPKDPHLEQGDVRFEPLTALIADDKGLADIRWIASKAPQHLTDDGWLMFEHGYDQGLGVRAILEQLGFEAVETAKDYAGNDRVTLGKWTHKARS